MTFIFLSYALLIVIPATVMGWLGQRYALRDATTMGGAIARALSWSLITCWTVMLVTGGMVPGIIPVPWWAGAIYSFIETDSARGINHLFAPHLWVTPALPIGVYLISYKLSRRQGKAQSPERPQ